MNPENLLTTPLGSGRRINVIREWSSIGLMPSAMCVAGQLQPYSYSSLVDLTERQRASETAVQVFYHPAVLAAYIGKSGTWAGWVDRADPAGNLSLITVPDFPLHSHLKAQGALQGSVRKRTRLIDFNLVAYLLATKQDAWHDPADIARVRRVQAVLEKQGDIETRPPMLPLVELDMLTVRHSNKLRKADIKALGEQIGAAIQDPEFSVVTSYSTKTTKELSIDRARDLLSDLMTTPVPDTTPLVLETITPMPTSHITQYQALADRKPVAAPNMVDLLDYTRVDLDLLEQRLKTERARRLQAERDTRWSGAQVLNVSFDTPTATVPSYMTVKLLDGTVHEFNIG